MCITTQIDLFLPDIFTTSWLPSHSNLCCFKVTILAPLQWAHQTLSRFGFPTFSYSSCMYSPLNMWPMSNNITAFVLGLKSTYEGQHTIFGLLSLANFVWDDVLQFYPFTCNDKSSFFFMAECKYHIFLIHSSIVGNFGCFHNLAIVNTAPINMGVQAPME
jgi:hypothetical protein